MADSKKTSILTSDRRIRAFLSSTLQELSKERLAARSAIAELGQTPIYFEEGSRPHRPRSLYQAYLEQSDLFIGIYWESYGWVAPDMEISGIEDEFNLSAGKPRLIYIKSPAPSRQPELDELLKKIKDSDTVVYASFETPDQLAGLIKNDLAQFMAESTLSTLSGTELALPLGIPLSLTPFIGREHVIVDALDHVHREEVRLLTLTGTAGVGKTRIALELAHKIEHEYGNGAAFASLASLTDPDQVLPAISQSLGVREVTRQNIQDTLVSYLAGKQVLLVLDNFEHLLAAATQIAHLLAWSPELKIIITSRSRLQVPGEHQLLIHPMDLPSVAPSATTEKLAQNEAVALFIERARAAGPLFELRDDNATDVAAICHRVDGLPLAIELAAARTRHMSPSQLLERLEHRLALLTEGLEGGDPRHRTLRAAIDWSYDLLSTDEQAFFQWIAIFPGGTTLEAADAVIIQSGRMPEYSAVEGVSALVDANLLQVQGDPDGGIRFRMLESIREYALEKLEASGNAGAAREAHARHYLASMERAEAGFKGSDQATWFDRLDADHDNLRAGLTWFLDNGTGEQKLLFAGSLAEFWLARGYIEEGRNWVDRALAGSVEERSSLRATVLHRSEAFAMIHGDYERCAKLLDEAEALLIEQGDTDRLTSILASRSEVLLRVHRPSAAMDVLMRVLDMQRETGDKRGEAITHSNIARLYARLGDHSTAGEYSRLAVEHFRNDSTPSDLAEALSGFGLSLTKLGVFDEATKAYAESYEIFERLKHKRGMAYIRGHMASAAMELGELQQAKTYYDESLYLFRNLGDLHNVARIMLNSSNVEWILGHRQKAHKRVEEARAIWSGLGNKESETHALVASARFVLDEDVPEACRLYQAAMERYLELGYRVGLITCVRNLAETIRLSAPKQAARLFGAAEAARETLDHFTADNVNRENYRNDFDLLKSVIGEETLQNEWDRGRSMQLGDAVAEAMQIDCTIAS